MHARPNGRSVMPDPPREERGRVAGVDKAVVQVVDGEVPSTFSTASTSVMRRQCTVSVQADVSQHGCRAAGPCKEAGRQGLCGLAVWLCEWGGVVVVVVAARRVTHG